MQRWRSIDDSCESVRQRCRTGDGCGRERRRRCVRRISVGISGGGSSASGMHVYRILQACTIAIALLIADGLALAIGHGADGVAVERRDVGAESSCTRARTQPPSTHTCMDGVSTSVHNCICAQHACVSRNTCC